MLPAPQIIVQPAPADPAEQHGPSAMAFLNHLRFQALACRVKPRADLFAVCATLQSAPATAPEPYAEALIRCLGDALGRAPRLHRPGTAELTFDEHWLIRLGIACVQEDHDSRRFLLGSRIRQSDRRMIGFLIAEASKPFHLV